MKQTVCMFTRFWRMFSKNMCTKMMLSTVFLLVAIVLVLLEGINVAAFAVVDVLLRVLRFCNVSGEYKFLQYFG